MKKTTMTNIILVISALAINNVSAQQYIFPKNGQTKEQQQQDEYTCHTWAVGQTNFDPTTAQAPSAVVAAQPQAQQGGSAAGGVVRGAAAGAIIAKIGGNDAGNGAAKGAAVGGLMSRRHHAEASAHAAAEQQAAAQQVAQNQQAYDNQLQSYNKARNVCLDGKGYSISN